MAIQISGCTVIDNSRRFFSNASTRNFFAGASGNTGMSGTDNVFIGNYAGCSNSTGCYNNFFGNCAGCSNTSGGNNNFFGKRAGRLNTGGSQNNFIGNVAGCSNTSGQYNNFFGFNAGQYNTTGSHNHFIGANAGRNNTTACNNIAIGQMAGNTVSSPNGLINFTTTGNQIVMGNNSHTVACIQIAWTTASDIRYKCVWGNVSHGRDFLSNVNPIKYSFVDPETQEVTDTHKRYGFSAQEVLALEGEESIIVSDVNPDNLGMNYDYMIPILVNAIKELDTENKSILARLEALENSI